MEVRRAVRRVSRRERELRLGGGGVTKRPSAPPPHTRKSCAHMNMARSVWPCSVSATPRLYSASAWRGRSASARSYARTPPSRSPAGVCMCVRASERVDLGFERRAFMACVDGRGEGRGAAAQERRATRSTRATPLAHPPRTPPTRTHAHTRSPSSLSCVPRSVSATARLACTTSSEGEAASARSYAAIASPSRPCAPSGCAGEGGEG